MILWLSPSEWLRRSIAIGVIATACWSVGCAHVSTANVPKARKLVVEDHRHPDGVAIDPASSPPPPADRAVTEAGLVTLRTPLGIDRAVTTVAEFFKRVVAEDGDGLSALLTRDATAIVAGQSGQGQTPSASLWWEQRFRRLDYNKFAGELIYREAEIEIYRGEDVLEVSPHPAIQTETLHDNDVVIRVPIITARIGADRLFGDEIVIWLRRDGSDYKIYRLLEDFQMQ